MKNLSTFEMANGPSDFFRTTLAMQVQLQHDGGRPPIFLSSGVRGLLLSSFRRRRLLLCVFLRGTHTKPSFNFSVWINDKKKEKKNCSIGRGLGCNQRTEGDELPHPLTNFSFVFIYSHGIADYSVELKKGRNGLKRGKKRQPPGYIERGNQLSILWWWAQAHQIKSESDFTWRDIPYRGVVCICGCMVHSCMYVNM